MAWCPKCKNEYKSGITICSDCGEELVERLDMEEKSAVMYGEEALMNRLCDFLVYNNIPSAEISLDEKSDLYEVKVENTEINKAKKIAIIFLKEEKEISEQDVEQKEEEEKPDFEHAYVKAEEKAENYKSSAYLLILVGTLGMIFVILFMTGVIQINIAENIRIISYITLTILFMVFLIMGVHSARDAKKYSEEAEDENNLTVEITQWFLESYTSDMVEQYVEEPFDDDAEEVKYFKRIEAISALITKRYEKLDKAFLNKLIDDLYQELYGI